MVFIATRRDAGKADVVGLTRTPMAKAAQSEPRQENRRNGRQPLLALHGAMASAPRSAARVLIHVKASPVKHSLEM